MAHGIPGGHSHDSTLPVASAWFPLPHRRGRATGVACSCSVLPLGSGEIHHPTRAGSGTDPAMRIVTEQLGRMWGQQTVLVNQPGAGGVLAARADYTVTVDGHTLFMAVASTFTVLPQLQPNLPINVDEFVPIGFVGEVLMAIAVTFSLLVSSLPE